MGEFCARDQTVDELMRTEKLWAKVKADVGCKLSGRRRIQFSMEQKGLMPKDLQPMIDRLSRVYEIFSGARPLTLAMIWRLHEGLGIPAECLVKQPAVAIA